MSFRNAKKSPRQAVGTVCTYTVQPWKKFSTTEGAVEVNPAFKISSRQNYIVKVLKVKLFS